MGSITKHVSDRTGAVGWRARYRDARGTEHGSRFTRKRDAEAWLSTAQASVVAGSHVAPSAGRVRFEDYAEQWRAVQNHRPTTRELVRGHFHRHVYPVLGHVPIADVRPMDIQGLVATLDRTLAASTVTTIYRYVAAVFGSAVNDDVIARTPCKVKRTRKSAAPVVPIDTETVSALAAAATPHLRALVVVAASTGLRQGELFGLTVDRLDLLRGSVRVDRQLVSVAGERPEFGPPKTATSYRTVPLPRPAVDALAAHLAAFPTGPDGLVFRTVRGGPLRRSGFGDSWRALQRRAGLGEGQHVRFHDLRHYYASLLIAGGESVKTVQARLGHASATETLDTYGHLWPESDDRTRGILDGALGGAFVAAAESPAADRAAKLRPNGRAGRLATA